MGEQPNVNSDGIKVLDACEIYFQEVGLPDLIRDELRERILDGLKNRSSLGGGIALGHFGLEVYESGSEYYVNAAIFNYVMEQLRLEGLREIGVGQLTGEKEARKKTMNRLGLTNRV